MTAPTPPYRQVAPTHEPSTKSADVVTHSKLVKVGCNTCGVRSDYLPFEATVAMVSVHGWATCDACNRITDPGHPADPPVMPFERPA